LKLEIANKSKTDAEYEILKRQLDVSGITLQEVQERADKAAEEENKIDGIEGGSTSGATINVVDPNGKSTTLPIRGPFDDNGDEPEFTSALYREATGQNSGGGKIVT
jgi:hypothetical protein